MKELYEKTSKFLSYVLRHKPEAIGLNLDQEGWASIKELINCAAKNGEVLTIKLINQVVINSDKKRFSISDNGSLIRAVQGHSSSQVNIIFQEKIPPEFLYHGTASRFLASIKQQGLIAGKRHYVHLSKDEKTATEVGERYGKPIILTVTALSMYQQGYKFYLADNGVWLTESVPVQFLQ